MCNGQVGPRAEPRAGGDGGLGQLLGLRLGLGLREHSRGKVQSEGG